MNKKLSFAGTFVMGTFLTFGLASCGEGQNSKTTEKTAAKTEKVEKEEPVDTKDIFFYTAKHRADKYQPTEELMGFSKDILYVGDSEFAGNTNIKEVWFGPKMNHIVNNAFKGCTSLRKVHFQGPVAVINDNAFEGCTALETLNVDAYTVGTQAFMNCKSLTSARFGEHIWWIRVGAFEGCSKLRSILMGITMKKLDDGAFTGCTALEEISIPNDFKNRMFAMIAECKKMKKIYLLSTEFFEMPKSCVPLESCTLYVPDAFLKQYQADAEWNKYGKIEPLSKSAHYTAEGFWKQK